MIFFKVIWSECVEACHMEHIGVSWTFQDLAFICVVVVSSKSLKYARRKDY